jgi:sporulation protein YlmC with PRC-barrel domain
MLTRFIGTAGLTLVLAAPALSQVTTIAPASPTAASRDQEVQQMKPDQLRASKMIGRSVYGPEGKAIGDVADLILDRDGRVAQMIIGVGGFLGLGDKPIAVPMGEVKLGAEDRLTVNLTKEQLKAQPRFEFAAHGVPARSGSSAGPASARAPRPATGSGQ